MKFLSLGFDCKVAEQIHQRRGQTEAYFFDWLMSPRQSMDILLRGDDSLLRSGRWDLVNDGTSLRDLDNGLMFMHEFEAEPRPGQPGLVLADRVEAHLPTARSKFNYLRRKTLDFIRDCPELTLVRFHDAGDTEALEEINHIRQLYLPVNPRLHFVLASTQLQAHAMAGDTLFFKTGVGPDWRGDPFSWELLFQAAELNFGPATAEMG